MGQLPVMPEGAAAGAVAIPLSTLARFDAAEGPNQISRENGKRLIVVQANVRGRDLRDFVTDARVAVRDQVPLPAGSWLDWAASSRTWSAASARLAVIVPVVFLVIAVLLFFALGSAGF